MTDPRGTATVWHLFTGYLERWSALSRSAQLYLLHAAFLTGSLAVVGLVFNLAIGAFGYPREFLGLLNSLSIGVAAVFSLPLWWIVTRIGLRRAMLLSAVLQTASVLVYALWPATVPLLIGVSLTGAAAVLFQVSSPPFMMQHSDATARDHLFSANAAINTGVAGMGALVAGQLPALFGHWLGVGAESALAYRATFAVAGVGLLCACIPLLFIRSRPATTNQTSQQEQRVQEQRATGVQREGAPGGIPPLTHETAFTPPALLRQAQDKLFSRRHRRRGGQSAAGEGEQGNHKNNVEAFRYTDRSTSWRRLAFISLLEYIPEPYRGLVRRPWSLVRLLISPFMISWGAALLIVYLNLFFKQRFAIGDNLLGVIFAVLNVSTGLAALLGPIISIRIGKIRTVALMQALSIPFLLMLGFVPILGVAVGAAVVRAALFNMGTPLYDAFAMEQTEERARPVVIGLVNGAYTAGYLVAPYISTMVQTRYGFAPLFVATAVCYTLAAISNYWFFIHHA